jgi:hypothetical protein
VGQLFQLVNDTVSPETIEALAQLLEDARAGRIIGLAWVARHRGSDFTVDAAGAAKKDPTTTRGMVQVLDDELGKLINR